MTDQANQEHATVREWLDLLARCRFGTVKVSGKTITSSRIKQVAGRMANYADSDGTRVRPGLPRLAVDLEISHDTAGRAVQVLHRVGLLTLVRAGARPGHADEYRLTIPVDLLEHLTVLSPAQQLLEMEQIRRDTRGRYKPRTPEPDPEPTDLHLPQGPADPDVCTSPEDPQESALHLPQGPADSPDAVAPAPPPGSAETRPAPPSGSDLHLPQGPATDHGPSHNYDLPTEGDHRSKPPGPRPPEAEEPDSDLAEVDEPSTATRGCPDHGPAFSAGNRPDGRPACPLCRATNRRPAGGPHRGLAPVIPIRSA